MVSKINEFYNMLKMDRKNSSWSKENTIESRYDDLFSEVIEIKEALQKRDIENLKEELGDSLWDLLYMILIAEEKGLFAADDVIQNTITKLKRRKPWIFTGERLPIEEEKRRWKQSKEIEKQKKREKQSTFLNIF